MPEQTRTVSPGPEQGTVITQEGKLLRVPASWDLLPPGDATITRRVKKAVPTWTVKVKRGRRMFSQGIWADAETIRKVQQETEAERNTPAYAKKRAADLARKARDHKKYVAEFEQEVIAFLQFHARHKDLETRLARAITELATPVGSGTVARTKRISVDRRAEAAVIAWMRHQTTAYDNLKIPRVKGKRREVRRKLAEQSRRLLNAYRIDSPVNPETCPLQTALS